MTGTKLQYGDVPIGEAPANWGKVKVDDNLVQVLGGFSCARTKTVPAGVPHLRPMNVATNGEVVLTADTQYVRPDFRADLEDYYLQPGDLLFNNTNSVELVGKTAIVRKPMAVAFSNHINRLRVKDPNNVDPRWLALALRSLQEQGFFATHSNKWIGQAGFSVSALARVDIPIPFPDDPVRSLPTQQRIVARIEALFAELRECRKLHQAVVEDTNRLMEAVRNELFLELETRVSTSKFDAVAESRLGKMLSQQSRTGEYQRPYLRNANVLWDDFGLDDLYRMNFSPDEQEIYRVLPGDLLICEGGEIGRTAVWEGQLDEVYFQKALHRARLRNPNASPRYLMHFMAWVAKNGAIARLMTGAALPHLTGIKLKTLDVIWPDPDIQSEIVYYLDSVAGEIEAMHDANRSDEKLLAQMERAILAQAFRGEL